MERNRSNYTPKAVLYHHLLPFFFLFFFFSLLDCLVAEEPVGYGYKVESVNSDPSGKTLTANLGLINSSLVYGPDIPNLKLYASYETKERLRIRITDSNNQRWEIPQDVLTRQTPQTSISENDLVFNLQDTAPFGFTVTRRSSNDVVFDTTFNPFVRRSFHTWLTVSTWIGEWRAPA